MHDLLKHDVLAWTRADFPLLQRRIDGQALRYLDSAATAPKPQCVIDAVNEIYSAHTGNVHRGVHVLSEESTDAFERARQEVASFINAAPSEIIFTRNTTESINLVAHGLGLDSDDEVLITAPEHHSNFLPWRLLARAVPLAILPDGLPRYDDFAARLGPRTRLAALAHVSNTLGVVAPVESWIAAAHARDVPVLVDASQSASHVPLDVKALDCDFLVFSGHKLLGPSGIGVLYGKRERLEKLALYQVGGGMVKLHGDDSYVTQDLPWRFEAGTPNIEGAVGLGAAVAYLRRIGMDAVRQHSQDLGQHLIEGLRTLPDATILADSAPLQDRIGLASFSLPVPGLPAEAVARMLCDRHQILVSGGYHCAHILHHRLKLNGTVRASTHVFNTHAEIDELVAALRDLVAMSNGK
jgi:cysteine desulfurase/selenocysteine lyase